MCSASRGLDNWEDRIGALVEECWEYEFTFLPLFRGWEWVTCRSLSLCHLHKQTYIKSRQATSYVFSFMFPHACSHKPVSLVSCAAQSFNVACSAHPTTVTHFANWLHCSELLNASNLTNGLFFFHFR